MSGPVLLLLLLLGGGTLLFGTDVRRRLSRLPRRRRKAVTVGALALVGVILCAVRLVPLGVVAFIVAGGLLARRAPAPPDPAGRSGPMTKAEACRILGLEGTPTDAKIDAAHRRLIAQAHPDAGGSADLAARVNAARDVLRR